MIVEVAGRGEPLATHATLVGLLATVDPPVGVEGTARGETFATYVAYMGLLSSVRPHVPLQEGGSVEGLAALRARQHRPLSSLDGGEGE